MLVSLLYCKLWNLREEATNCVCPSGDDDAEELEEGEWIPEEDFDPQEDNFDEGFFLLSSVFFVMVIDI